MSEDPGLRPFDLWLLAQVGAVSALFAEIALALVDSGSLAPDELEAAVERARRRARSTAAAFSGPDFAEAVTAALDALAQDLARPPRN